MIKFDVVDDSIKKEEQLNQGETLSESSPDSTSFNAPEIIELEEFKLKIVELESQVLQKSQQFEALEKRFRQLIADSTEAERNWKRRMDELESDCMKLSQVTEIFDLFRMGVEASKNSPEVYQGMKMAYDACVGILSKKNVKVIEVNRGGAFDPTLQKVIGTSSDSDVAPGMIISGRPGYAIFEGDSIKRVIRHAEVILSEANEADI